MVKNNIKTIKINNEGVKLATELVKLKLELCLKYTPQPQYITLNYLNKQFKNIEMLYYGTRYNIEKKSKTF